MGEPLFAKKKDQEDKKESELEKSFLPRAVIRSTAKYSIKNRGGKKKPAIPDGGGGQGGGNDWRKKHCNTAESGKRKAIHRTRESPFVSSKTLSSGKNEQLTPTPKAKEKKKEKTENLSRKRQGETGLAACQK